MNTSTLDKLRKMKFFGMFRTFKTNLESGKLEDYTADEMIANLIEADWDDRYGSVVLPALLCIGSGRF